LNGIAFTAQPQAPASFNCRRRRLGVNQDGEIEFRINTWSRVTENQSSVRSANREQE
jgi:hypothetical protein